MDRDSRIVVLGASGMVGSALRRELAALGYCNVVGISGQDGVDLRGLQDVQLMLAYTKAEYVFLAAAHVGGIMANSTYPAEFSYDNLTILSNVVEACQRLKVKKLIALGSSCIYPRDCPQPIKEEYLLTGPLEPTNEPYAIAKIAGVSLCEAYNRQYGANYLCGMPCNLYGPGDNFDAYEGHFAASMMRAMYAAVQSGKKSVKLWGDGTPRRELMYVGDCARALLMLMEKVKASDLPPRRPIVNIGVGEDFRIAKYAETIAAIVGYEGEISWDEHMPNGTPRKLLDISLLRSLGWNGPWTGITQGMERTFAWYRRNVASRDDSAPETLRGAGDE